MYRQQCFSWIYYLPGRSINDRRKHYGFRYFNRTDSQSLNLLKQVTSKTCGYLFLSLFSLKQGGSKLNGILMKTTLLILLSILLSPLFFYGQITTPIIKARFGVDADLRANYFNGAIQSSNDDWFNLATGVLATDTTGKAVIDTTGAAAILAGYLSDVSPWPKRMASFYRGMSKPKLSIINNRLWVDAAFVRDYHGNDSTVFTVASKNGESPAIWTPGVQSIPDKNDILDMMMHV